MPVAARLLTLADHPGLNLIVVLNSVGDAAHGCHARSGLVMEMPRFHDTLRNARTNAARMTAVPQSGREPYLLSYVLPGLIRGSGMTAECITPLTYLERDALCELANVAMARAAVSLRLMVGHQVLLSVPTCEILPTQVAVDRLAKPGDPHLVAVRQDFSGPFSGRALLIFPEANSLELTRAVLGRQVPLADILDLEDEALAETGNIILNSWVATIANLLKQNLKMSLPTVIRRHHHHIFESATFLEESRILFLHIKFEISEHEVQGFIALMMDVPSMAELRSLVAEFVKSLTRPTAS